MLHISLCYGPLPLFIEASASSLPLVGNILPLPFISSCSELFDLSFPLSFHLSFLFSLFLSLSLSSSLSSFFYISFLLLSPPLGYLWFLPTEFPIPVVSIHGHDTCLEEKKEINPLVIIPLTETAQHRSEWLRTFTLLVEHTPLLSNLPF